jgi:hypothetical protein
MIQVAAPPVPPAPPGIPVIAFSDLSWVIHQLVPLLILVVVFVGVRWVFRSPIGEAIAERIRTRGAGRWGAGAAGGDAERVAALETQVSQLHSLVAELGERLDFAERLLAERRERKVGAGQ